MPRDPSYLSGAEASQLVTQAMPGALVLHLKRAERRMFIELTLGEAVQHWQQMGELIRKAGAMGRDTAHVDTAPNL